MHTEISLFHTEETGCRQSTEKYNGDSTSLVEALRKKVVQRLSSNVSSITSQSMESSLELCSFLVV